MHQFNFRCLFFFRYCPQKMLDSNLVHTKLYVIVYVWKYVWVSAAIDVASEVVGSKSGVVSPTVNRLLSHLPENTTQARAHRFRVFMLHLISFSCRIVLLLAVTCQHSAPKVTRCCLFPSSGYKGVRHSFLTAWMWVRKCENLSPRVLRISLFLFAIHLFSSTLCFSLVTAV